MFMEFLFWLILIATVIVTILVVTGAFLLWIQCCAMSGMLLGIIFAPIWYVCYIGELPDTRVRMTWLCLSLVFGTRRMLIDFDFWTAENTVYIMNKQLPPSQPNSQDDA